jgi:RNA polymerase sigma-70 factor (ECF subfamily)
MDRDDGTLTRASLLLRIRDAGDRAAWEEFVGRYAPLVYRFARRRGLQDADAADLTQEVLQAVAGAAQRLDYDPSRGSFRGWLFTVSRNRLVNLVNRRARQPQVPGDTELRDRLNALLAPAAAEEDLWEQEYQRSRLAWAAELVKVHFEPTTWQAFWRTAVAGESPRAVAECLGLSVGAVHIAKSRVIARLKTTLNSLPDD